MSNLTEPDNIRRHFDRRASSYARTFSRGPLGVLRRNERRQIFALLEPRSGETILDAGCGVGLDAKRLLRLGCAVHGIDLSPAMVELARAGGISAEVADLHELELGRSYSKILSAGSLEFCADPARVIERLARHLEPGGRLVILFPTRTLGGRLYKLYYRVQKIHVRLFESSEMMGLLARAALNPLEIRRPASLSAVASAEKPR